MSLSPAGFGPNRGETVQVEKRIALHTRRKKIPKDRVHLHALKQDPQFQETSKVYNCKDWVVLSAF